MKGLTGKGIIAWLLCAMLMIGMLFIPMNKVQAKSKKIALSNKKITIVVGKSKTLRLKNAKKAVKWKTSSKKKVTVKKTGKNKCKITAKKTGKATITAVYKGKKYKCSVTVKKAKKKDNKDKNIKDAKGYTYNVTPLLAPFNEYFYIKTDNPDPKSFRFIDKDSKYLNNSNSGKQKEAYITPTGSSFCDVSYENLDTKRVRGGYIASGSNTDGGSLVLQTLVKTTNRRGDPSMEFKDTALSVQCADVIDYVDYLIQVYTNPANDFFTNVGEIQRALDSISIYPRGTYDKNKPNATHPYPFYTAGYYLDQTYLLSHYEDMYESAGKNLGYQLYPYVLSSLGFPGTIIEAAKRLNPNCTIEQTDAHYLIGITWNGETHYYGGAGNGGYDPLYTNHVSPSLFSFQGDANDFATGLTLDRLLNKLKEYDQYADADSDYYEDLLEGDTFHNKVKERGGTWIRIYGNKYAYASTSGYTQGGVWVDGRYVEANHAYVPGAAFVDHPTATIIKRNMTYVDYDGNSHTEDVSFHYDSQSGTWSAAYNYKYHGTYEYVDGKYQYVYDENHEVPEEFILTLDEGKAMNIDRNKDVLPEHGLIYDGTVFPGTEF